MIEGRAEKAEAAHENDVVVAIEVEAWSASKEAKLKREAWKDSLEKVLREAISLIENTRVDGTEIDVDPLLKIAGDAVERFLHALSRAEIDANWRFWVSFTYFHIWRLFEPAHSLI